MSGLLLLSFPAAACSQECDGLGDPPLFASAGFFSGDSGNGKLMGNAFAIIAKSGAACGEKGASSTCEPAGDERRGWTATMVTAAHVVQQVCSDAPGKWSAGVDREWHAARLTLIPGYKLENVAEAVEVKIDKDWCERNFEAAQIVVSDQPAVGEDQSGKQADLYVFSQEFLLPRRAVMVPFSLQIMPKFEDIRKIYIQGLRPQPDSYFQRINDNRRIFFGKVEGDYTTPSLEGDDYPIKASVIWGQSGSPVGFFDRASKRFSVFGVLTKTGRLTCSEAIRIVDDAESSPDEANNVSTSTADTDDSSQNQARCNDPAVAAILQSAGDTAAFVPIARNPSRYAQYYGLPQERVDAVNRLFAQLNDGKTSPARDLIKDALSQILGGSSPLEQMLIVQGIDSGSDNVASVMCKHVEPSFKKKP